MEWARSRTQPELFPYQQSHPESVRHLPQFLRKSNGFQAEPQSRIWKDLSGPIPTQGPVAWEPEPASIDLSESLFEYDTMMLSSILNDNEVPEEEIRGEMTETLNDMQFWSDSMLPYLSSDSSISPQQLSDLELDPMYPQRDLASQAFHTPQTYTNLQSNSLQNPHTLSDPAWMPLDRQSSHRNSPPSSLSPFSIDQRMINASNCQSTSANLFRIYHDVLEHNLSCWLNEMTCPYQPGSPSLAPLVHEWGSSWSNRIYQRTISLDRAAQSCKLLQLTRTEDQAASKALHLAIMAFATQWAQGSQRQREKYSDELLNRAEDEVASGITDEFDSILQKHFWDQAQQALQQVADLESYKVVSAELIFGLIQKPRSLEKHSIEQEMGQQTNNLAADTGAVLSKVKDIIQKDGPPIYVERATRKIHALKYRYDALNKGLGQSGRGEGAHEIETMGPEDRGTVGLLYWLAIMFDTVSSSMNERPVVILDQDCEHERQKETQRAGHIDHLVVNNRWDLDVFVQGNLKEGNRAHWPCSYEAAAEDVVKSAPVKVLLFRHLSYLQSAVRKGAHEEQIEDIIRITISLYEYWNRTHGAFFRELVQNYSAVPQRIQGWFLCISAHWHLAALMLADLLDFIDENDLGIESAALIRTTSQVARRMRKHSASELSDLARVGTPPIRDSVRAMPQMPDFHHAVSEGTLLTEPWTMMLIRAFTKSCMVFLDEANEALRYLGTTINHDSYSLERNMTQAQACVQALWLLGKKSDMSREIAETLSLALGKLRKGFVGYM
ncbi:hypothetical protein N7457_006987 [Penicillium paradoxum]|uniref:uncharacterized protein n=1 Tax=Penicillium paradoxum TaxID=176176 RepID=UPI00254795A6|nr:uncharacterized protein N7457_006987 [Penicillium paradoxum]KAJ5779267.1 hypothetical protein N7457_006987 [Penicillium paradoxum]